MTLLSCNTIEGEGGRLRKLHVFQRLTRLLTRYNRFKHGKTGTVILSKAAR